METRLSVICVHVSKSSVHMLLSIRYDLTQTVPHYTILLVGFPKHLIRMVDVLKPPSCYEILEDYSPTHAHLDRF